ncbi:MAG: PIN domain-containing protein [Thermodesulfobacteriota bacterium]
MRFYWDTCIFISWLKNENIKPGLLEGIEEIVKQVDKKEIEIITSVLTHTEMLRGKFTDNNFEMFKSLFKRPNIVDCEVTGHIAEVAGEIRNYYSNSLSTPDAIHLATAIVYEVDEMHTSDGSGKKNGLIQYSGMVADKFNITIKEPLGVQYNLL